MLSQAKLTWGRWTGRPAANPPTSLVTVSLLGIAAALLGITPPLAGQTSGEEVFQATCVVCHTLGTDRLVGPGLADVENERGHEWLISFITEPDRMIASGDSIATRLLAEYTVPMPNVGTTRAQAEAVLDFIASADVGAEPESARSATAEAARGTGAFPSSEDEVRFGRELFQGPVRFTNGGPTCNACHDVVHDGVIGGGALATDLTYAFSRIGGPGVRAILANPPFPLMQQAYTDNPLTDVEVDGLAAFLQEADSEQDPQRARRYGAPLLAVGVTGSVFLLGLFSLMWRGRRKGSINQALFDRQVGST